MRKCGKTPCFLIENNNFFGIHLPADFTAEHEWGIVDMKKCFGIPNPEITCEPFGLVRRKATKVPDNISFIEDEKNVYFFMDRYKFQAGRIPTDLTYFRDGIGGAWDGNGFGVVVPKENQKYCARILEIKQAIENCDVAVFLGGGGVFENSGLNVAISSRIPKENIKMWEDGDQKNAKLYKDADETGIKKKLEDANLKYYALSPSRPGKNMKTKHKVVFWLNPRDQESVNYGMFTVENLEQWIKGEGPIPKTRKLK